MTPLAAAAGREIEELHQVFVELFTHRSRDLSRCEAAFATDFEMVSPDGRQLKRHEILASLVNAATGQDFRIEIADIRIIFQDDDSVLLQYVEQQYRDGRATRRLSVALLMAEPTAPCKVVWRYLHETWMQDAG
jgi:hypothetical protein